jgi:hypothetical protein
LATGSTLWSMPLAYLAHKLQHQVWTRSRLSCLSWLLLCAPQIHQQQQAPQGTPACDVSPVLCSAPQKPEVSAAGPLTHPSMCSICAAVCCAQLTYKQWLQACQFKALGIAQGLGMQGVSASRSCRPGCVNLHGL